MMMERDAIARAVELLNAEDFYVERHRRIFNAIVDVFRRDEPVDMITAVEELRRRDSLEDDGVVYLTALIQDCPSAANIDSYAAVVVEKSELRQVLYVSEMITNLAYGGDLSAITIGSEKLKAIQERRLKTARATTVTAMELASMELPAPRWAVPELLPQGLSILGGKMKMGKSWFSYALALSIANGSPVLGSIPVEAGDVLYLALEDPWLRLQQRLSTLLQSERAPERLHLATEWPTADAGGLDMLERWLQDHPDARLIVIDVLQKFRSARKPGKDLYAEDYDALTPLKALADKYGIAILLITHLSKRECDDPFDAMMGTMGIGGAVDGMFALDTKRGRRDATLHMTGRDIGFERKALLWNHDLCTWSLEGDADEWEEKHTRVEILRALRSADSPQAPKDIADVTNISPGLVKTTMWRMAKDGQIKAEGYGQYKIVKGGPVNDEELQSYRVTANSHRDNAQVGKNCNSVTLEPENGQPGLDLGTSGDKRHWNDPANHVAAPTVTGNSVTLDDEIELDRALRLDCKIDVSTQPPERLAQMRRFVFEWYRGDGAALIPAVFDQKFGEWLDRQPEPTPIEEQAHEP